MALSTLPVSYCANVHPALTLAGVLKNIDEYAAPLQRQVGQPIAVGLWLPDPVVWELRRDRRNLDALVAKLAEHQLTCYTLNAFPFGNFHAERVKEQVYLPDWAEATRAQYTIDAAIVLADIMEGLDAPEATSGSLSTSPLAFAPLHPVDAGNERYFRGLFAAAQSLAAIQARTGRVIRLAIEPEPCCLLQTTAETLTFFEQLQDAADRAGAATAAACRDHLGVCLDVCHQAVEFEDLAESVAQLDAAGVPLVKVHITCALELREPANPAARAELAHYIEPRYLHQTFARHPDGRRLHQLDLDQALTKTPATEWLECPTWRVHFHVPVNATQIGLLHTTRPDLERALAAVAQLKQTPHLEVETYTWAVLPGGDRPADFRLVDGLAAEMQSTLRLLDSFR